MMKPDWKQQFDRLANTERVSVNKFNPVETFTQFINSLRNENMGFPPEAQEIAEELSKKYGKQVFDIWTKREK